MSSTGSIRVKSPDSVKKFGVSIQASCEITSFSHDDMCQWNRTSTTCFKIVQNSWQQVEHVHSHEYIHMKTRTGGAVPIMNQHDTCQLVQKWFLVCWVVRILMLIVSWCREQDILGSLLWKQTNRIKQHNSIWLTYCSFRCHAPRTSLWSFRNCPNLVSLLSTIKNTLCYHRWHGVWPFEPDHYCIPNVHNTTP